MTKEQEFRKQTEEAKFEAFSLMCKKVAELEKENAEMKETVIKMNNVITETFSKLTNAKELLKRYVPYRQITDSKAYKDLAEETEQFLNSEVEK